MKLHYSSQKAFKTLLLLLSLGPCNPILDFEGICFVLVLAFATIAGINQAIRETIKF
jgi:hypothetical protein